MHAITIDVKEAINLKESKEGFGVTFKREKRRKNITIKL